MTIFTTWFSNESIVLDINTYTKFTITQWGQLGYIKYLLRM